MRRSLSLISTSTSSASGSTATVTVEVWMRPWLSVAGTRCTRCTPDSYFSRANTLRPVISAIAFLDAAEPVSAYSMISNRQPFAAGVFLVHAEQFGGEQAGLVAAGRRADFQDGAAGVGFVARQQGQADLLLQGRQAVLQVVQLGFRQAAHFGVGRAAASASAWRVRRRAARRCARPPARARTAPCWP